MNTLILSKMKIETKEIYKCDFCKKLYQVKRFAEQHERVCFSNPQNLRPCNNCEHLVKKSTTITTNYNYDGSEQNRNLNLFYCNSKKSFLYTPKNEIKNNQFELEESNIPMPKICEIYCTENIMPWMSIKVPWENIK